MLQMFPFKNGAEMFLLTTFPHKIDYVYIKVEDSI